MTNLVPSTYTKRSNAKRAGLATFGEGKFEVIALDDGKFTYQPLAITAAETDSAPVEPSVDSAPATAPVVAAEKDLIEEAQEMGRKRSEQEREGAINDALKQGELSQDKETARAAVRKLERLKADIPDSLREKAAGKKVSTIASRAMNRPAGKPTTTETAPKDGTMARKMWDRLVSANGATNDELKTLTGWKTCTPDISMLATKYGKAVEKTGERGSFRYFLR